LAVITSRRIGNGVAVLNNFARGIIRAGKFTKASAAKLRNFVAERRRLAASSYDNRLSPIRLHRRERSSAAAVDRVSCSSTRKTRKQPGMPGKFLGVRSLNPRRERDRTLRADSRKFAASVTFDLLARTFDFMRHKRHISR